ncbi:MAG TPA: hypothetical protein VMT67_06385 [Terriglobales bacterium]|nr:hypothetical protein [Terriglobales bacterium]
MTVAQKAGKIGLIARVAGQQLARSRTGAAIFRGVRAAAGSIGSALHQLWLEVTGFTFLAIALFGGFAGFHEYNEYHAGRETGPGRLILAVCFTVSFAWFGLSSFVRIKTKRKT